MIMQETELKKSVLPTFSVSWIIILILDVNMLYYKTKICFIDLVQVRFPLQDLLKGILDKTSCTPHYVIVYTLIVEKNF